MEASESNILQELTGNIDTASSLQAEQARIAATIGNWKRKLLDVSKRNRALSFRPNKVTTIIIVDEQPAEVFRHLYLQEKQMRFRPSPPTEPQPESALNIADTEEGEDHVPSPDFIPYTTSDLDSRHTDDALQTAATAENLDKSLRRIAEQAQTSIEEQGVNTLFLALGMLYYKEASASDEVFRAPLVLLPVALQRKSARAGYTVAATDDDPMVNPALAEYLRRAHGITLPDLPDLTSITEQYDLQRFFVEATEAIANQAGWQVKTDIYLSFFSFQKFIMYKDLEANLEGFGSHPLVRQIILRSGESICALPEEIRAAKLDDEFPPEQTAQVVNADSSQLRAILAVSRNHNLVLEGPPGTGKSQTITNLIAQALAENKSVLFVAEKMAALEVVYRRLVEAGLGEFCLELHSTKANKRAVMRELATALDASLQRPRTEEKATGRIGTVRAELSAYARAVHEPFGALQMSPYRAYGELELVLSAPKLKFTRPVEAVTREQMENAERDLREMAEAAQLVGDPAQHAWRDTTRTLYTEQDLDAARDLLDSLRARLKRILELAAASERDLGLSPIANFADARRSAIVAEVIARSPGAPLGVLQSEAWDSPPPPAIDLVKRGRTLAALREEVERKLTMSALDDEHASDVEFIEAKENSPVRFLNFLSGRFRAVKHRWLNYRQPSYQPTLLEQSADMRKADAMRRERAHLETKGAHARELFGALWEGEDSGWDALDDYIGWVVEFRRLSVENNLREQTLAIAARSRPDVSVINDLRDEAERAAQELNALQAHVGWAKDYLTAAPFTEIAERVEGLYQNLHLAPRWATFEQSRAKVADGLAAEFLEAGMRGEVAFADLAPAFRRAFFSRWLSEAVGQREPLRRFNTLTHEQRIAEFRNLDESVLLENRAGLVRRLRDRVQAAIRAPEAAEAMPFLRRQLTLQRGLSSLRTTFQRSSSAIRAIKPVLLMSPLTVAQLLDGKASGFDLVIFDEASQLPAEDAVGAIARGRQLVVVGDPKQLPPTNFFSVMSGTTSAPIGDDGTPLFEDSESILEEFMGSGAPMTRLKWHYRSAHESLIYFSNVSFYDSDLYTFPSVETNSHTGGLSFEYVPEGVYEGKGLNIAEARRVAEAVVRHAKTQPELSLGVGTFNLRQQIAIQDELEVRRRQDPSLESFFARDKREPFFVKNLENIQGDERDVIFLSVTYAKDANGVLRYNFGPLNGENGWRRLNVLTTRARRSMRVFSSMKGDEINPARAASQGPQLLRDFLLYAERGQLNSTTVNAVAQTESLFEREVYMEIARRGVKLQPQVGVAGYRIDLGVLDDETEGRFLCGIECDGAAYHASETARDRDRLRQQVLEARGWTIHRLWSTDWFKDRNGQIERLLDLIERTRVAAREERAADEEARTRAAAIEQAEAQEAQIENLSRATETPAPAQSQDYVFADTPLLYHGQDFHSSPASLIEKAIGEVAEVEAPLHIKDLAARVVARWGYNQVGQAMMRRIRAVAEECARQEIIRLRGDFIFKSHVNDNVRVRSRAGTRIPPERIAPEEYKEAVLMVLRAGDGRERRSLTNAVRSLFGFNRTGTTLDAEINDAIDDLLAKEIIGEGSAGIKLRA